MNADTRLVHWKMDRTQHAQYIPVDASLLDIQTSLEAINQKFDLVVSVRMSLRRSQGYESDDSYESIPEPLEDDGNNGQIYMWKMDDGDANDDNTS